MNSNKSLRFSIIICAHDRKKYLVSTMESAVKQTFSRDAYEIILVKNFEDQEIDSYANENNITLILTKKGPLMQKMLEGVEKARGEYMCFLEDDDLYEKNKLSRINELIEKHGSISFYHSSFRTIDENGNFLAQNISSTTGRTLLFSGVPEILSGYPELISVRADWYGSMMCVRKEALTSRIDQLKNIEGSADKIVFYMGLLNSGTIVIDSEKTTRYRFHMSHTNIVSDPEEFYRRKESFFRKSYDSSKILKEICKNTFLENITSCMALHEQILLSFVSSSQKYSISHYLPEVLKCFSRQRIWSVPFWYSLLVLKRIFRKSALKLYYVLNTSFNLSRMS